jgi:hypothetical protein
MKLNPTWKFSSDFNPKRKASPENMLTQRNVNPKNRG